MAVRMSGLPLQGKQLESVLGQEKQATLVHVDGPKSPESYTSGSAEASGPEFSESDLSSSEVGDSDLSHADVTTEAASYWAQYFAGCQASRFLPLPSSPYIPNAQEVYEQTTEEIIIPSIQGDLSVVIKTAWAILLAHYTGSTDVVFGQATAPSPADTDNDDSSAAQSNIAIAPLRAVFEWSDTVQHLSESIQKSGQRSSDFEHIGLPRIRHSSAEAELACQFQSVLYMLPEHDTTTTTTTTTTLSQDALSLICKYRTDGPATSLALSVRYGPSVLSKVQAQRVAKQFALVIKQVASANSSLYLADIDVATADDLNAIWTWNAKSHAPAENCIHDLIAERARLQPNAPAVCAWDGDWTYSQLNKHATQLARTLVASGLEVDTPVLLFFEKSKWMPVAQLGVIMAGGACVATDVTMPQERLRTVVQEVGSTFAVTSNNFQVMAQQLGATKVVVVDKHIKSSSEENISIQLPTLTPANRLYITFTSGSTGKPKGSVHTHRAWSSAIRYQREVLGYNAQCRIFDFASYAFDMAWSTFLHGLTVGACMCVPSQEDRMQDPAGAMARLNVNYTHFTPTVARLVPTDAFANVHTIRLGGEASRAADISRLAGHSKIINIYAPSECAGAITYKVVEKADQDPSLGMAVGANTWLVSPHNRNLLAAVGAVGELWLEGPLVSNGYLDNLSVTASSFIEDPSWLLQGGPNGQGRHGRFYKTGDLARYDADGSLIFIGRNDEQVKIHGQRVELGDVEHSLEETLLAMLDESHTQVQVVAEVFKPTDADFSMLVAFVRIPNTDSSKITALLSSSDFEETIVQKLPAYMIPGAYIPKQDIPMTVTGKVFRRQLRNDICSMTKHELIKLCPKSSKVTQPESSDERAMQGLWASVLNMEASDIGRLDNFFKLGGDSIAAICLVQAARKKALLVTYADIFRNPILKDLAAVTQVASDGDTTVAPFSLITNIDSSVACSEAAKLCGVGQESIEDLMPCTPLQEGMLAMTSQSSTNYIGRFEFVLRSSTDRKRLQQAWEATISQTSILRTRIVHLSNIGLAQVVLSKQYSIVWDESDLEKGEKHAMGLGTPLLRQSVSHNTATGLDSLVFTMHHALYDGWSMSNVLDALRRNYQGVEPAIEAPYASFIKSVVSVDTSTASEFWQKQFVDLDAQPFPSVPADKDRQRANKTVTYTVKDLEQVAGTFTLTTAVRAAWSVLSARYTYNDDVMFGAVSSGRQSSVAGIEDIRGPTIATVPIRVNLNWGAKSSELLARLQDQMLDMNSFEQSGLQNIQRMGGEESKQACSFQTLLVVQPEEQEDYDDLFEKTERASDTDLSSFSSYALLIEVQPQRRDLVVRFCFDASVIDEPMMSRIGRQFEHILRQICNKNDMALSDITVNTPEDLKQIWSDKVTVPAAVDSTVVATFAALVRDNPNNQAVAAWDGDLTYRELDLLSTHLAMQLTRLGTYKRGRYIPLLFEKSKWMPVSILGVMKAGHGAAALDGGVPEERLRVIIDQIRPPIILTTSATRVVAERAAGGSVAVLAVDQMELDLDFEEEDIMLPLVVPEDPACLQFTSGSTGIPKGVILTHRNFCTAMPAYHENLVKEATRIYDFVSHAFDISWVNFIDSICSGRCLCIPSEDQRKNSLIESIARLKADWAWLPSSLARTIKAKQVPSLKRLMLGGEAFQTRDFVDWYGDCEVITVYGPSEATSIVGVENCSPDTPDYAIGRFCGANLWILQSGGSLDPVPVGAIGELAIEGPLLAAGYLNNPQKTAEVFVENPKWMLEGAGGEFGRKGRFYRTGDLARYNSAGQLIYMGRKDVQVKIRGQRVELGDIEHHARLNISTKVPIADAIKPLNSNQKVLVMFLSQPDICGESLEENSGKQREHLRPATNDKSILKLFTEPTAQFLDLTARLGEQLKQQLPTYMVPTMFIPVKHIPRTQTDKIDRKALKAYGQSFSLQQLLELGSSADAPQKPQNELEMQLCEVWANVLGVDIDTVATNYTFFQSGGDSIKIMSLVRAMEQAFGQPFTISVLSRQDVTIQKLAETLSSNDAVIKEMDMDMKAEERSWVGKFDTACTVIEPAQPCSADHKRKVFLTGANGYLGTQILKQLVANDEFGKIYVLVRAHKGVTGMERIEQAAKATKWWTSEIQAKVEVWNGDISKDKLGLNQDHWTTLTSEVDCIVHNAAVVNWSLDYGALEQPNIVSTLQLLQLTAMSPTIKHFTFISGGIKKDQDDEETVYTRLNNSDGYCQSKYIAERLTLHASNLATLTPASNKTFSVIKPGLIIGNADHGISNLDDFTWRIVSSAVDFKAYPIDHPSTYMYLAECNHVAETITTQLLSTDPTSIPPFTDITRGMSTQRFWDLVQEQLHIDLRPVSWDEWKSMAQSALDKEGEKHRLWPVQTFLGRLGHALLIDDAAQVERNEHLEKSVARCLKYLVDVGFVHAGERDVNAQSEVVTRTRAGNGL